MFLNERRLSEHLRSNVTKFGVKVFLDLSSLIFAISFFVFFCLLASPLSLVPFLTGLWSHCLVIIGECWIKTETDASKIK